MYFAFRGTGLFQRFKSLLSALLITRYILRLGQRGRCCFCDACPNRKMYLEIRCANERAFTVPRIIDQFGRKSNQKKRKEVDYKISFSTYVCYTPDGLF